MERALTPTADNHDDQAPFVRVLLDRATGRAVIALDRAAVDALIEYFDGIGPGYDLTNNPGFYGLADDQAARIGDVVARISGPLSRLYR